MNFRPCINFAKWIHIFMKILLAHWATLYSLKLDNMEMLLEQTDTLNLPFLFVDPVIHGQISSRKRKHIMNVCFYITQSVLITIQPNQASVLLLVYQKISIIPCLCPFFATDIRKNQQELFFSINNIVRQFDQPRFVRQQPYGSGSASTSLTVFSYRWKTVSVIKMVVWLSRWLFLHNNSPVDPVKYSELSCGIDNA